MARGKLFDIVKSDLERFEAAVKREANGIRLVVVNTVKSALVRRIFNNGIATDGSDIGKYKRSTKIFRNGIGRRIDKVDLEVTGTLRGSVQAGTYDERYVLGIVEVKEPKISFARKKKKFANAFSEKKGAIIKKKGFKTAVVSGLSDYPTTDNAIDQETNFGKDIFAPTKEEIELGNKTFQIEINEIAKRTL